ncbi:MAG: hypothetical protein AAF764_02910 [Pseudomonadota bacterium]
MRGFAAEGMDYLSERIIDPKSYDFGPKEDLEGKSNFGRHIFIERDGCSREIIRLNVLNDRHREEIIAFHFAQQYANIHYSGSNEQPQFYVVGRDNPWDFEYVMHDGSTFNVEICRVADRKLLKAMKAENDVMEILSKPTIKGYEVLKVERLFPGLLPQHLTDSVQSKRDKTRSFSIRDQRQERRLFLRPAMEPASFDFQSHLVDVLSKKASKRHSDKDDTIIIVDNLTTHIKPKDVFAVAEKLAAFLDELPFPSIWFYTGYYSALDGTDYECSLIPLKMTGFERGHFSS